MTSTTNHEARPDGAAVAPKRTVRNSFGNSERGSANSDFLTVREAGEYLNTSDRFVRRMIEERRIAFHHFGRHLRFARADLDAFVAAGRVEIPPSRRIA